MGTAISGAPGSRSKSPIHFLIDNFMRLIVVALLVWISMKLFLFISKKDEEEEEKSSVSQLTLGEQRDTQVTRSSQGMVKT